MLENKTETLKHTHTHTHIHTQKRNFHDQISPCFFSSVGHSRQFLFQTQEETDITVYAFLFQF
uniref:Uncharacterized protein n=1 Tax=Anguilla anguilla TaxID=7936 RepID=A0A0E9XXH8_ANGAN